MLAIRIIEGHNKFRIGRLGKRGIKYRGRLYSPVNLQKLDQCGGDPGGALAGAAVGGVMLGVFVGSALGGRGRTAFIITITEGYELVGTVPAAEYVELYVEIERLKKLPPLGGSAAPDIPGFGRRLIFGPFYFGRFGTAWFVGAFFAVVITRGGGGLAYPAVRGGPP